MTLKLVQKPNECHCLSFIKLCPSIFFVLFGDQKNISEFLVFLLSLEFSWVCFLSVCLSFSTFRSYKYKKVWKSVIRYNKCSWIIRGISFQWLLIKFCGLIWWLFYNQTPVCSEKHLCILLYSILFCFVTSKSTSLPDDCY